MIPVSARRRGGATTDPNFANVVLLMHGDGANGSTTFTDSSSHARVPTVTGTPTITNANSPIGGGSILIPTGNSSCLHMAASSDWSFAGDFTIEARVLRIATGNYSTILASWSAGGGTGWFFAIDNNGFVNFWFNGSNFSNTSAHALGVGWHSLAISRVAGVLRIFIDGVIDKSLSTAAAITTATDGLGIFGQSDHSASLAFSLQAEEIRITNGVGRYSANYTPATTAFPNS